MLKFYQFLSLNARKAVCLIENALWVIAPCRPATREPQKTYIKYIQLSIFMKKPFFMDCHTTLHGIDIAQIPTLYLWHTQKSILIIGSMY